MSTPRLPTPPAATRWPTPAEIRDAMQARRIDSLEFSQRSGEWLFHLWHESEENPVLSTPLWSEVLRYLALIPDPAPNPS
jgi:hypothetical protein